MKRHLVTIVPGLVAGLAGGWVGFILVRWASQQGFYVPVLPGALCGVACGLASRSDSHVRGILCAVEALTLGLVVEWRLFPLRIENDGSFRAFLSHLGDEPPITLLMLGLGTFLGYWWGREWTLRPRALKSSTPPEV